MAAEIPIMPVAADVAPALESAWTPSTIMEVDLEAMVVQGLLLEKSISGWKSRTGVAFPSEDRTETVVFRSFFEKGFSLPVGAFFRRLLHYYGLEASHLKPNSIV
ncbi:putative gypsy type transposon [Panicum miliaceum]|uniref:Gypsy type transposon n=1 Tax=Panicum miliaceum TaxID=4540 RepID=A0A3L6RHW1_PANMI|nr:putative gypsy type transposon [Panicum miliaceum]